MTTRTQPEVEPASAIMLLFAERTGLISERPPQRYLWTDAFAVCNFLALAELTGEASFLEHALRLAHQVHHVLGRHRSDDPRSGWISGLDEADGEAHPTRGGLRIGKPVPERKPGETFDERLEWDRDGQYFHYLTKWMLALDQLSRRTGEPRYNRWARELAESAHDAFTSTTQGGSPRMVWKMSVDLSRPLVSSMGHHDPLDGLVTCLELRATASLLGDNSGPSLEREATRYALMTEGTDWATLDPLGIGGILMSACHLAQLGSRGRVGDELLDGLLLAAARSLGGYLGREELRLPAARRLGFRELGLAIGLSALDITERGLDAAPPRFADPARLRRHLELLRSYAALQRAIVAFWLEPDNRRTPAWSGHRDINEVMLATGLVPRGCLVLSPPPA